MDIKANKYKISKVYIQNETGEYQEVYALHPDNRLALGPFQVALLEINKNKLTSKGIDKLIEFLQTQKNTS